MMTPVGEVDHLGGRVVQVGADGEDALPIDQEVDGGAVSVAAGHGQDAGAGEQDPAHQAARPVRRSPATITRGRVRRRHPTARRRIASG